MELWIKRITYVVIELAGTSTNILYNVYNDGQSFRVQKSIKLNEWYHLSMSLTGSVLTVYHNGVKVGQQKGMHYFYLSKYFDLYNKDYYYNQIIELHNFYNIFSLNFGKVTKFNKNVLNYLTLPFMG